jgi:hypothetical protein
MPFWDKAKAALTDLTRPENEKGKSGKELVEAIIASTDLSLVVDPKQDHPHEIIYRKMVHLLERVAHVDTEKLHTPDAKESADLFSAGRLKSKVMRHHRKFSPQITAAVREQARVRPGRLGHLSEEQASNMIGELLKNLHQHLSKPIDFSTHTESSDESFLALAAIQQMLSNTPEMTHFNLPEEHDEENPKDTTFSKRNSMRVVDFGGGAGGVNPSVIPTLDGSVPAVVIQSAAAGGDDDHAAAP